MHGTVKVLGSVLRSWKHSVAMVTCATGDQEVTRCRTLGPPTHGAPPALAHSTYTHAVISTYTHAISISPAYCIVPSSEEWAVIAELLDSC